jgi:hypothetical protein
MGGRLNRLVSDIPPPETAFPESSFRAILASESELQAVINEKRMKKRICNIKLILGGWFARARKDS